MKNVVLSSCCSPSPRRRWCTETAVFLPHWQTSHKAMFTMSASSAFKVALKYRKNLSQVALQWVYLLKDEFCSSRLHYWICLIYESYNLEDTLFPSTLHTSIKPWLNREKKATKLPYSLSPIWTANWLLYDFDPTETSGNLQVCKSCWLYFVCLLIAAAYLHFI